MDVLLEEKETSVMVLAKSSFKDFLAKEPDIYTIKDIKPRSTALEILNHKKQFRDSLRTLLKRLHNVESQCPYFCLPQPLGFDG